MQRARALHALSRPTTSREAFDASPYRSLKVSSYFDAYDELFARYQGKAITFVEIGVLDGGSLFMWRDFFGAQARIIGVELNPAAQRWREHGFEIFTGSQSDAEFWASFRQEVGPVDILLDDGGHTFRQQIATVEGMLPAIRDGGLLVVEDTHSSYLREFGGPSRKSFMAYAKGLIDQVNYRFPDIGRIPAANRAVHRLSFFESIVALHVDRGKAMRSVEVLENGGEAGEAVDYRYAGSRLMRLLRPLRDRFAQVKAMPVIGPLLLAAYRRIQSRAG